MLLGKASSFGSWRARNGGHGIRPNLAHRRGDAGAHRRARGAQCRGAGGASGRRQVHQGAAGAGPRAVGTGQEDHRARAAAACRPRCRHPHGHDAWRSGRRDRRLSGALRLQDIARDPHRGGHRGRVHAPGARRSGARRRRGALVRRVPRTLARRRSRPRARPRRADRLARGSPLGRHVGDPRWRPRRQAVGRRAGDREPRPRLPGRDPLSRPRCARADRAAGGRCRPAGDPRRCRLGAGVPAGRRRDPPRRAGAARAAGRSRARCGRAPWHARRARAGSRHRAGAAGPAQDRAGDLDRRNLAHHRGRPHRDRLGAGAGAAL